MNCQLYFEFQTNFLPALQTGKKDEVENVESIECNVPNEDDVTQPNSTNDHDVESAVAGLFIIYLYLGKNFCRQSVYRNRRFTIPFTVPIGNASKETQSIKETEDQNTNEDESKNNK